MSPRRPPHPCSVPGCPALLDNRSRYCTRHRPWTLTQVCGPPGAGKTTHVQENRQPQDLVIDYDTLASALGSTDQTAVHPFVCEARDAILSRLHRDHAIRRVWVIRTAPDPMLGNDIVTLDPGIEECRRRVQARPGDQAPVLAAIDRWYHIGMR